MMPLLVPMMFLATLTQIQISPTQLIQGIVIKEDSIIDQDYIALYPDKWVLVKSLVESADGECKSIITDAVELCQHQLEGCHETCNNIPDHQKNLIKVLKQKVEDQKLDIKAIEAHERFWRYTAIIAGSVALSASTYILIK